MVTTVVTGTLQPHLISKTMFALVPGASAVVAGDGMSALSFSAGPEERACGTGATVVSGSLAAYV
jgi:hypothetical protein